LTVVAHPLEIVNDKEDVMTAIKALVTRHPVRTYFVLAFAISWGAVLLVIGGPGRMPGTTEQAEMLLPFVVLAMLPGPAVAGILLTSLLNGKAGLRDLLSRMLTWRVGGRWYAVALVGAPVLVAAILLALSLTSPAFLPGIYTSDDKATILLISIAYGLGAGFFEELGWTGFAVPILKRRYSVLATGLIVGIPWGVWHFITNFWGSGDSSGALSLAVFLPAQLFAVGALPAYRVLMVWVYDHTGSLLVAMLMHASFTASWLIVMPAGISGAPFLTWYLVWTAALWVVVAAVVVADGWHLSHQPLRTRAA
jgi:membrane protease YdiL (CAAX protease family)